MIKIENIKKEYGRKIILRNVSIKSEEGKCIGILGSNGSGKSTLLKILAGIIKGDDGIFSFNGTDLLKNIKRRSEIIGYVPQNTPLFEELSARDNLRLWYSKTELKRQLENGMLSLLELTDFIDTPVCKLSGGMKKRLSIGCAVSRTPRILIMDEPSAALDIVCKEKIISYLQMYKASGGTVIIATHDIREIFMCDNLYILKNGDTVPYEFDGNLDRLAGSL